MTDTLIGLRLQDFLGHLASDDPTPGGGSASALAAASAASLVEMVARLTTGRVKFAEVEGEMTEVLRVAPGLRRELAALVDRDTQAFDAVMAAMRLPRETDEQKEARRQAIEAATKEAARVPLRVVELACEVLALARVVAEKGNPNAITDAGVAGRLALAGAEGAALNVLVNLPGLRDETFREETRRRCGEVLNLARSTAKAVAGTVERRMA